MGASVGSAFMAKPPAVLLAPGVWRIPLIGDYVRRHRTALAVSLFVGSSYVGGGFALVAVGALMSVLAGVQTTLPLIGEVRDWQLAFIISAMPLSNSRLPSVRRNGTCTYTASGSCSRPTKSGGYCTG